MNISMIQNVTAVAAMYSAGPIPAAHPANAAKAGAAIAAGRKRHPASADPSVDRGFI